MSISFGINRLEYISSLFAEHGEIYCPVQHMAYWETIAKTNCRLQFDGISLCVATIYKIKVRDIFSRQQQLSYYEDRISSLIVVGWFRCQEMCHYQQYHFPCLRHHCRHRQRSSKKRVHPQHPDKQQQSSTRQIIAEIDVLRERIKGCSSGDNVPHIVCIAGDSLGVGVIRIDLLDCLAELGIPKQLTDVSNVAVRRDGVVGEASDVHVREQKSQNIDQVLGDRNTKYRRKTSVDVDVLNFKEKVDTVTVEFLLDITTNLFAGDVVRPISHFRAQDTTSVGAEDDMFRSMHVVMVLISTVVIESIKSLEGCQVTLELLRSSCDAALLTKVSDDLGATSSRTSGNLEMLAGPATSIDGASDFGSKSLAGLDLSLYGMVIVMFTRDDTRLGDDQSRANESENDFREQKKTKMKKSDTDKGASFGKSDGFYQTTDFVRVKMNQTRERWN
ncbi:aromatic compound dioxygenase, partial [Aureobasidium melanogenum]